MPPRRMDESRLLIAPLTFLQTYRSAGKIIDGLSEKGVDFGGWFKSPHLWRRLSRFLLLPAYYHLMTSGYGAILDEQLVGWLYLRGRQQVIFVEVLTTHPAWRRRGVATTLLRFAETQARELHREWMALTVSPNNKAAIKLYERAGYQRGHWRVLESKLDNQAETNNTVGITLRPVFGLVAQRVYERFAAMEQQQGDPELAAVATRLIGYEPYRYFGPEWLVEIGAKPVGFIQRGMSNSHIVMYVVAHPDWWGRPEIVEATMLGLRGANPQLPVQIRLGSSEHHEKARGPFAHRGFVEQPARNTRMFKRLAAGTG